MSESEKTLTQQNKEIEADAGAQAKKRLSFLLGQSDLFKHFGLKEEAETKIIKFANTLSDLIRTNTDPALLEAVEVGTTGIAFATAAPIYAAHG